MFRRFGQALAAVTAWTIRFAAEVLGAVADHRKWIHSSRAQALEGVFEGSGRLLTLSAYVALAYLGYHSWLNIDSGLAGHAYPVNGIHDSQLALFAVFAASLLLPIALIGTWIAVGTVYNVIVASGQRLLARFVWPLIRPAILLALAAALAFHQAFVEASIARGYLHVRAALDAATGKDTPVAMPLPNVDGINLPGSVGSVHEKAMARIRCADEVQPTEQCAQTVSSQ